jgi:DNA sulfur modification protein DndB
MNSSSFEYVFPVIKGIQAGKEFYTCLCPVRILCKLFPFDPEEIPPEMRVQKALDKVQLPEIARYILENPIHRVFSSIAVFIDAEVTFEPSSNQGTAKDIGLLRLPMEARCKIYEGQHRLAALKLALLEKPELGDEHLPVNFYPDIGLKRWSMLRSNHNLYGIAAGPDPAYTLQYDHREYKVILTRAVITEVTVFRVLTDTERSSLPVRSKKLFTFSAIQNATLALLANYKDKDLVDQIELAIIYWSTVCTCIPDWEKVLQQKVSAGAIRREYVHSHAVTLAALGYLGTSLISLHPENWQVILERLQKIDWSRSNPEWEGRVLSDGRVSKSLSSVSLMTSYLKKYLGLPLTPKEERLEIDRVQPAS